MLGIAIFSAMDAVMKGLVLAIGVYTAVFWRSLASTLIGGVLYALHRPPPPSRAALAVHAMRGVILGTTVITFFWGLARIPMAQAIALSFLAPLLSLLLAALLLGERVRRATILASLTALAGVAIILLGQWRSHLGPAALAGSAAVLASALAYAFNIVLMRRQALLAGPVEVAFSQSLIVTALLALALPVLGAAPSALLHHLGAIVMAAALAVLSLMLLAWAYARAQASYLAASEYTAFVWACLFGWLCFHERLSLPTLLGAGLIVTACLAAARQRA